MTRRADRVAEAVQHTVAELLLRGIKDPRVGMVTVTGVRMSADLRHARVFFTRIGDLAQRNRSLEGLRSASGFIRAQVGRRLGLRVAPQIVFEFDPSFEEAERVSRVLKDVRTEG